MKNKKQLMREVIKNIALLSTDKTFIDTYVAKSWWLEVAVRMQQIEASIEKDES